jgi:hypothetical protein
MLPTQSLIYFLLCGAGIIVFIILINIPNHQISAGLDGEIEKLNDRIEQQKILRPVFDSLLERAKQKSPTNLPTTKNAELELTDINRVSDVLQELAGRHGLKIQEIRTDVNEMMNGTGYMLIRISATGDFMKFRGFMLDLGTIPSLEQIEELKIRAIEGDREYGLRLWLAQK